MSNLPDTTALKANLDSLGVKHFGGLPKAWDGASSALLTDIIEGQATNNLLLAVIGREHFGNPIPRPWYDAVQEFLTSFQIGTEVVRPRGMRP